VVENVTRDGIVIIIGSQAMVVVAFLPKIANADIPSLRCRRPLEVTKQPDKVRGGGKANQFEVCMAA